MLTRITTLTTALILALPGIASAQNLVGHWTFDGNQNDSSGRNNQVRRNNAATYVAGKDGQALELSGKPLTISNSPSLQTNQFTVDYSVYMNTPGNYMPVASKGAAWQINIVAGVDSDGRAIGGQSLQFCTGGVCKTSAALARNPAGRWMEIQFAYDGTTATGYADGAPVVSFDATVFPGNSAADIQLGNASGSSASDFNGLIRDLKIYDAAIKPALVAHLSGGATLGATARTVGSAETSSSVVLGATGAWTATANNSFLHVNAGSTSGTGNALVIFSVDAFTGTGSRSGTLTIAGLTLTVTQAGINYVATPQAVSLLKAPLEYGLYQTSPTAAVADGAGNVYFQGAPSYSHAPPNSLDKLDVSTGVVTILASGIRGPMAISCCGDLFILDTGSGSIKKWNISAGQLTTVVSGVHGNGIAVDSAGSLYIADTANGAILKYAAGQLTTLISGLKYVYGVAVDAALNVYYSETDHATVNKQSVVVYNGDTAHYDTFYSPAGTDNGVIRKWNATTGTVTTVVALNHPFGIAVDGSGNLYCIDYNYAPTGTNQDWDQAVGQPYRNILRKWTAATGQLVTIATGGYYGGFYSFLIADQDTQVSVAGESNIYFPAYGSGIWEVPYAFVPSVAINEPLVSGADVLPAVLPVTTALTGLLSPVSDQAWLTIGAITSGITHFSFTAHPSAPTTAHITIDGIQSSVTQVTPVPNVIGQTQADATTALTNGFLQVGNVSTAQSTVEAGLVISSGPAAGTQVPAASAVNLLISAGKAALGSSTFQTLSSAATSSVVLSAAGDWTATANNTFLHLGTVGNPGSSSGTGSALIGFTVDAFPGTGTRIGTLTIAGLTFTVTQYGTNFVATQQIPFAMGGFHQPSGIAVDGSGTLYVADPAANLLDVIPTGQPGPSTLVSGLNSPSGVATDSAGNVYFSDLGNNAIKKWIAATQQTVTLVSTGLANPWGVAVDSSGNVYIGDSLNNAIKVWNVTTGAVTTLVSGANQPYGVAVDRAGNVYFADALNNAIKKWSVTAGTVTTLVSTGLNHPEGIAVDGAGNLYIADTQNQAVKKWTAATGQMTTLEYIGTNLGPGNPQYYPVGLAVDATGNNLYEADQNSFTSSVIGNIKQLTFGFQQVAAVPNVVALTQAAATSAITGVSLTVGAVTTGLSATVPVGSVISTSPVAGTILNIGSAVNLVISAQSVQVPNVVGQTQAAATTAITGASLVVGTVTTAVSFTIPAGSVISENPAAGATVATSTPINLVVSSGSVAPDVIGQSLASATSLINGAGLTVGSVTTTIRPAGLNNPGNVISDLVGNVYIANTGNNAIEKWNAATGQLTTVVSGLNQPGAVAIDKAGNLYIADTGNNAIKKWDAVTNQVTTLISTGLNHPQGIVVDRTFQGPYNLYGANQVVSNGNVYISDTGNNAIKVWNASTQQVTTLVSSGLNQPTGLGWCVSGPLYIADTGNNAIKSYTGSLNSVVSAGLNHPTAVVCAAYVDNAIAYLDGIHYPVALDFIPSPDLYIADTGNNAIKYWPSGNQPQLQTVASGFNQPLGIASDGLDTIWVADTGNNRLQMLDCLVFNGGYCGGSGPRTTSTLFRGVPPGTVVSTNPVAGTSINVGSAVNLTIDGGVAALSSNSLRVGNGAGSSSVFLAIQVAQGPWTATANDSFLHLGSGSASGSGSAWLTFTIDAFNTTGIRTGTLTIAGFTFTVTQVGTDYAATTQLNAPIAGGLNGPESVAVDGFGNLYIADTTSNSIRKWTSATQQISTLISSGITSPHAVVVDGNGNLYIGDATTLQKWTAAKQQLTTLVSNLSTPSGIFVDSSDNVYYTSGSSTVAKWTASTQAVTTLLTPGMTMVRGVTLDSSGNVWLADAGGNTIRELVAGLPPLTTQVTGLNGPWGLAFDRAGDMYFSDGRNSAIKKLSVATGNVTTLVQGNPAGTTNVYRGISLDASGNLYFAERSLNVIGQLSKAYVSSGSLNEPATAGSGALPPVIPLTTDLTGASAPTSDQSWLTVGAVVNGVVNFSFAANGTGGPRTGHITVLGIQFTITQGLVAVPNVVGQTQAAATTAITGAGLVVGTVTTASSSTVDVGKVISTSPTATTQVNVGSAVNLVVSTGLAQVAVPNVVGQTQAGATTAITGAGLVLGTVTTASSSTVVAGSVISSSPIATTQVNAGSSVNLVVSTGPAQVAVPNVVGQTQLAATSAITGAGLVLGTVTTASSSTVVAGSVIGSSPIATTQVNAGSSVNLVVSTGPAQVAVPNVVGQTQVAATSAITGAGLVLGTVATASSATVAAGSVISSNPTAATQVNVGSALNLVVSTGPAQVPALDITAQFTITRGAVIANKTTGRVTQSVTVLNSGAAISAAAFVLDSLASGYGVYQPTGLTVATIPVGSPFKEVGPIGAGASVTLTIELTRTGTPALTYTPRILGLGTR